MTKEKKILSFLSGKKLIINILMATFLIVAIFMIYNFIGNKKSWQSEVESKIFNRDLDIIYGVDSAQVTVYLYFRYDCVFCRKFFNEAFDSLKAEFIETGKVRLVMKPVELTGNESVENSLETLVCINKYGNPESLQKLLLTQPNIVYTKEFREMTEGFIAKDDYVAECMLGGVAKNYLLANKFEFEGLKLTGTPTFVINGSIYKGFRSYQFLRSAIKKEL